MKQKWFEDGPIVPLPKKKRKPKKKPPKLKVKKSKEEKPIPIDERQAKFLENYSLGMPINQAAMDAGYSKTYSHADIYKAILRPSWRKRIEQFASHFPENRRALAKLRLGQHFQLEQKFLDSCQENPKLYAKHGKSIADRDYSLSGLGTDDHPPVQTVNIQQMQVFMQQIVRQAKERLNAPRQITVDAQIEAGEEEQNVSDS